MEGADWFGGCLSAVADRRCSPCSGVSVSAESLSIGGRRPPLQKKRHRAVSHGAFRKAGWERLDSLEKSGDKGPRLGKG